MATSGLARSRTWAITETAVSPNNSTDSSGSRNSSKEDRAEVSISASRDCRNSVARPCTASAWSAGCSPTNLSQAELRSPLSSN